jgi:hypothetical protein
MDDEAPGAPLNLTAEVVFNNVGLSWLPATDNVGVEAYNVYIDGALAVTTPATYRLLPGFNAADGVSLRCDGSGCRGQ